MAALLFLVCLLIVNDTPMSAKRLRKITRIRTNCFSRDCIRTNCPNGDCPVPKGCIRSNCPKPLCADPMLKYGQCCPTCEHSHCKFEGCVQYEPGERVRWYEVPCRRCECISGRTACSGPRCGRLDSCPAGSFVTNVNYRPYHCCPYCDYGAPEQGCQLIPTDKTEMFQDINGKCSGSYAIHKCDKVGFRRHGRKFRCVESWGERHVNLTGGENCGVHTYNDILSCEPKEDPTISNTLGCDIYV